MILLLRSFEDHQSEGDKGNNVYLKGLELKHNSEQIVSL